MLSHVANYRPICRWRKRKLRQVAKFFPPKRTEFLEQAASVAESAEKLLAAMRAHADACNRRQIPEAASPLPTKPRRFPMARLCRIAAWPGTGLLAAKLGHAA
jgi:hypothetical protein